MLPDHAFLLIQYIGFAGYFHFSVVYSFWSFVIFEKLYVAY